jgi:hypothetical protein
MKTKQKRDGFYMNVTSEERKIVERLHDDYAINLSQAFKIFLKQMLERMEKQNE